MMGSRLTEWVAVSVAFGWVWGSFLNTLIDRTSKPGEPPVGTPVSPARSRCLDCGQVLAWTDLVPIFSYLVLRGRCRHCGAPIGRRTLVIEVLTPLLFGAFALALAELDQHAAWIVLAGFGFATISWLLVALPLLAEGRRPKLRFLAVGIGLFAGLVLTAIVLALDVMTVSA
jgi:prepilin signal peptidase PulO-like enzyme (type II secretory pathway)